MRRITTTTLTIGTIAVTAALAPAAAGTGPATIRITTTEIRSAIVDHGRAGTSPGDVEVFEELLYNRRITPKAIGRAQYVCTRTFGGSRLCRGTYALPRGTLVVEGAMRYRQFYRLAIIGGTGLYDNARGSLTVTRTGVRPRRQLALFRLTG